MVSVPTVLRQEATPLSVLRTATRAHHDRIDRLMDLRRMKDRSHYVRVLQVFDAFLAPWEQAVAAALPHDWTQWLQRRSRRPFLAQDLQALGAAPAHGDVALPALPSAGAAWGSLYVIEGSALGGQVITRSLAEAGLHPGSGAAYFHGWGEDTGAMWREFRQRLEAELAQPPLLAQACEAACHTFDALSGLLEAHFHERPAPA